MAFQLSPSVDFNEIDLTGVVPAVSTSIGGYAGSFEWGPCEQIVEISNEKDLISLFGLPRIVTSTSNFNNQNDFYACANYLSYTSALKIVRGVSDDHKNASEYLTLVGEFRSSATFIPADLSDDTYEVSFDGIITGTNAEGQLQELEINASGDAVGLGTSGSRKRSISEISYSIPSFTSSGVAQKEKIDFEGTASVSGTITFSFGAETVSISVAAGETSEQVASKARTELSNAQEISQALIASNSVSITRSTVSSSPNKKTGVDEETGKVRRLLIDTQAVSGINAKVEIIEIGTSSDTIPVLIANDSGIDSGKSYILIASGDTKENIAFKLNKTLRNLNFVYTGIDDNVNVIGNTVQWTNSIFGSAPALDLQPTINPVDANTGDLIPTLAIETSVLVAGQDPTPPQEWTFSIVTDDVTRTFNPINFTVSGGSSSATFIQKFKEAIDLAGGISYNNNSFWTVETDTTNPEKLIFVAPEKSNDQKQLTIVAPIGNGITLNQNSIVTGSSANSAKITVNGIDINVSEGDSGADLAAEWKFAVESQQEPVQEFQNVEADFDPLTGTGARFDIKIDEGGNYQKSGNGIASSGQNYRQNQTLTIDGRSLGGNTGPAGTGNDAFITITAVGALGEESNIATTNGGSNPTVVGSGLVVDVLRNSSPTGYDISVADSQAAPAIPGGSGYLLNETIKIDGALLSGGVSGVNDIICEITAINNTEDFGPISVGPDTVTPNETIAQFEVIRNGSVEGEYEINVIDGGIVSNSFYDEADTLTINGSLLGGINGGVGVGNDVTFDVTVDSTRNFPIALSNPDVTTDGDGLLNVNGGTFDVQSSGGVFTGLSIANSQETVGLGNDFAVGDLITFDAASVGQEGNAVFSIDIGGIFDFKEFNTDSIPSDSGGSNTAGAGAQFFFNRNAGVYELDATTPIIDPGDINYEVGDVILYLGSEIETNASNGINDVAIEVLSVEQEFLGIRDPDENNLIPDVSPPDQPNEALFDILLTSDGVNDGIYTVTLVSGGDGYSENDLIIIPGDLLGGTAGVNNLVIKVDAVIGGTSQISQISVDVTSQVGVVNGTISAVALESTATGVALETGPIAPSATFTVDVSSGAAISKGRVTGIQVGSIEGDAKLQGTVSGLLIRTSNPVDFGPISNYQISGDPRNFKPQLFGPFGNPLISNKSTVEALTEGSEAIAPMVNNSSNPSQDFVSFGVKVKVIPKVEVAASYQVAQFNEFETHGDVTENLTRQLGDQDNQNFQPKIVTIENEKSEKASGAITEWVYDEITNKTFVTINHDGGTSFRVGVPEAPEDAIQEPENDLDGAFVFVEKNELIKNDEDFEIKKLGLDGGYFYAIYPGAKGNSVGVGLVDATVDATTYDLATFGDGTRFDDVFDGRPETSDFSLSINSGFNDELHIVVYDSDGKLTGTKGSILETYPFLSKNIKGKNNNGRGNYYIDVVNGSSDYIRIVEGFVGAGRITVDLTTELDWGDEPTNDAEESFGVMSNGVSSNLKGGEDVILNDGERIQAMQLLGDAETVDFSLLLTGDVSKTVKKYSMNIADTRRDVVTFISPGFQAAVASADVADVNEYFNNSTDGFNSSSYAVFDSGYKYQYDRYNNTYFWCPLSSDIAGLCARTDQTNDPWFSPGGENRGQIKNVVRLSFNPDKTARDTLYKGRINPVVTFTGIGTLLYGDKTALSRPSAFDRINVRRLFITLEKAISTLSRKYLFEFNDVFTRANFVQTVEPFLREVQSRRGVEEFRVICDLTNNTPQVINSNSFVGDIYIKPARSINFITLNFVAVNSGVEFEEVINPTGN